MVRTESPETRSKIMASIKSSNTVIEKKMDDILLNLSVKFEMHPSEVYGKPDFIIRDRKIAVFCDGDFWHGYDIRNNPRLDVKKNREYWMKKIKANIRRDEDVNMRLEAEGWKVIRFWEHDINKNPEICWRTLMQSMEDLS